jgi:hypothetical protein
MRPSKDRLDSRHFEQFVAPPRGVARLQGGLLDVVGEDKIGTEVDLCYGDCRSGLSATTTEIRIRDALGPLPIRVVELVGEL